jgi:hypothetical protein
MTPSGESERGTRPSLLGMAPASTATTSPGGASWSMACMRRSPPLPPPLLLLLLLLLGVRAALFLLLLLLVVRPTSLALPAMAKRPVCVRVLLEDVDRLVGMNVAQTPACV